jgi:hypothetical protein
MLNIASLSAAGQTARPKLSETLQVYERRFGSPPDWLDDLANGRIQALIQQALKRGAPLTAADVL